MHWFYAEKCQLRSPTMPNSENLLMTLSAAESRSVSPMTPSPSREIRGLRLFRAIGRKLGRRSTEDIANASEDADSRSSSTDSCSSTSAGHCPGIKTAGSSSDSEYRSSSLRHISSSSSDAGSDIQTSKHRHHHSTSAESVRKVFQNLTVTARSQSCSSTKENKRKSKKAPKRILRSPVTYTYVKGLSGLPTQRVPRNTNRVYLKNSCSCNLQYMVGLHR